MDKNRFVNSVNLNIGTRFPYFVVDAIDDKPFPPNPEFRLMHWHEDLQFILVTDGRITVQTLDEKVEVGAGEAIFINARVIHRITKIGTCRYRSFIFPASFLSFFPGSPAEDLVTRVTENQDIRLIRFSDDTDWNREVLARLTRLYKLEDQAKDETYAYEVLIELARLWLVLVRNLRLPDKQKVSPLHRRLQKMLQYISLHFSEPITLEDLARSASISKSEMRPRFQTGSGENTVSVSSRVPAPAGGRAALENRSPDRRDRGICGFCSDELLRAVFQKQNRTFAKRLPPGEAAE